MTYQHKIQYYETDKQGITHHSNYIRIMEETRVELMERLGFGYERMEAAGVFSPVMAVSCEYKRPTTFADVVSVTLKVAELGKLKVKFDYEMRLGDTLACHGTSLHCFLGANGRPVVLEERFPEFYEALKNWNEHE